MDWESSTRILCCPACGEPTRAPLTGGADTCDGCGARTDWPPRPEPAAATESELDEAARVGKLREQDGHELVVPKGLEQKELAGQRTAHQRAAAAVRAGEGFAAEEELFLMTLLRSTNPGAKPREQRAAAETALELCTSERYQAVLRSALSMAAARDGDLPSARAWIAPVAERSEDLYIASARAMSEAWVHTADGDWEGVLRALGRRLDAVPTCDMYDEAAELLRANALERSGDLEAAKEQLKAAIARSQIGVFQRYRARGGPELCPQTWAAVQPKVRRGGLLGSALALIPLLIVPVMVFLPGTFLKACAPAPTEMAMQALNACPDATDLLGSPIETTVGPGCGNMETGGGRGYVNWSVPVRGPEGGGSLFLNAEQSGGTWSLTRLTLTVDDQEIDVRACAGP